MDKSPDAFRTISEVAEHLETPAHVLRFWESRFPQIRPVKRAGGRRYYRPSDVSLLIGIKRLLHDEGMTIRGVQKILREQGVRHVAGLSGDEMEDGAAADAPYIDQIEDVVVPLKAEPVLFRPATNLAPGLAEAMAKAVDHGPIGAKHMAAPSTPVPLAEPAQGALLLTPAPVPVPVPVREAAPQDAVNDALVADDDLMANVRASLQAEPVAADPVSPENSVSTESSLQDDDFDDDGFEDGPITTLATRIRSLPAGASAAKVGAELTAAVARLQALRDRVADAAFSDRA